MPTFALNFSRPGAQILLQYWAFLRYGFEGYKKYKVPQVMWRVIWLMRLKRLAPLSCGMMLRIFRCLLG